MVDRQLGAQKAELLVRGVDGSVVRTQEIDPRAQSSVWDGTNDLGAPAGPGTYAFETRYTLADAQTEVKPAQVYGRVIEARREPDDSVSLMLEGGTVIPAAEVSALRGG
jgi:flagellar hook assembly protein FlgD